MNKFKLFVISSVLGVSLLFSTNVLSYTITDNQIVDSNKKWIINFTDVIGYDDLTKQGIVVIDNKGNAIDIGFKLGDDNKSIIVYPPTKGYATGENYTLMVEKKVHSLTGVKMKQDRTIHFSIKKINNNTIDYNVNIKDETEEYKQVIVTLDKNVDSSKYNVFLDGKRMECKDGYFTAIGTNCNKNTIRQYITIELKEKLTITKINNPYIFIRQNDPYILPNTIPAIMSDGTIEDVNIIWDKNIDTSKIGEFIFYGTVKGYNDIDNKPIVFLVTIKEKMD